MGLELVHRLHQLESLVPVLQGLGILGLVTNPFTALEPLTGDFSGPLRQASLSFAGVEPGTISTLHLVFWGLVVLVALGTLGRRS